MIPANDLQNYGWYWDVNYRDLDDDGDGIDIAQMKECR